MNFKEIQQAVNAQINKMQETGLILTTSIDKDALWDNYLKSFPEGSDPIFKERTEHDCQCCKQFIRNIGHTVAFINGSIETAWDINISDKNYQAVADSMSSFVKQQAINTIYINKSKNVGVERNFSQDGDQFNHFFTVLKPEFVKRKDDIASLKGKAKQNKEVLLRSIEAVSYDALDTVVELIDQGSLYRGEEKKEYLSMVRRVKIAYDEAGNKEAFLWKESLSLGGACAFKNDVMGTLLADISEGKDLESAVKSYESKVAPHNYKRPKALITETMKKKAFERFVELGLSGAEYRRHAKVSDITANNVLFADRSVKPSMGGFDSIGGHSVKSSNVNFDKVEEIKAEDFFNKIVPKSEGIEVFFDNNLQSNLFSLIAPENKEAGRLMAWDNNFSISYNGDVADSMRDRVKAAGGRVDAPARFSIQWNDNNDNHDDLDAHCMEGDGNLIYYGNKRQVHSSSGMLDVDIQNPGDKVAVENITWSNLDKMKTGDNKLIVHCFSSDRAQSGFTAEVELGGEIYSYELSRPLRQDEKIHVATLRKHKDGSIEVVSVLDSNKSSKQIWNINTKHWHKVNMALYSPNFWDGQYDKGNKHYLFVLDNCLNPDPVRGMYNEFLRPELNEDRKVFEHLASSLKAQYNEEQLSGLGFSSTQRKELLVKVKGSFNRVLKVKF